MRGLTTEELIMRAFGVEKLDIPKAPGLGLMLEEARFERYNKRFSGDGIHEGLIWSEYADFLDKFKNEHIYSVIVNKEKTEHPMISWLQTLPIHTYDIRDDFKNELPLEPTDDRILLSKIQSENEPPPNPYFQAFSKACINNDQDKNEEEISQLEEEQNGNKEENEIFNEADTSLSETNDRCSS
ncbi:pseudouridylate synthase-like protein [Dinothrombium tinctorium]|nr:pseudouridylate synthase-like protein [Dinothrombium tinctorium]